MAVIRGEKTEKRDITKDVLSTPERIMWIDGSEYVDENGKESFKSEVKILDKEELERMRRLRPPKFMFTDPDHLVDEDMYEKITKDTKDGMALLRKVTDITTYKKIGTTIVDGKEEELLDKRVNILYSSEIKKFKVGLMVLWVKKDHPIWDKKLYAEPKRLLIKRILEDIELKGMFLSVLGVNALLQDPKEEFEKMTFDKLRSTYYIIKNEQYDFRDDLQAEAEKDKKKKGKK